MGQQLAGVQLLIERYRKAGIASVSYDFYPGGRHEMLNEINGDEVRARLIGWINTRISTHALRKAGLPE
jgi:alpha-beta hydrolase superfamily lysophospholipase